jgi:hypothetical protein
LPGATIKPLCAAGESDDLVGARPEQRPVGARAAAFGVREGLGVKTRQHATAFVQRPDRVDAAGEADVQVHARAVRGVRRRGQFLQFGEGVVVAGVQRQHIAGPLLIVEGHGKGALQLGAQALQLWPQPRLGQPLGHQQALAEG